MADILTQLQDALDQLATQFYASIRYITTHHAPAPITTQPTDLPPLPPDDPVAPLRPDSPDTFKAAQVELAKDLIIKEQQIEYLISVLPGIGTSEREQEQRLKALEAELKEAEKERLAAVAEREKALEKLDMVITKVRRV